MKQPYNANKKSELGTDPVTSVFGKPANELLHPERDPLGHKLWDLRKGKADDQAMLWKHFYAGTLERSFEVAKEAIDVISQSSLVTHDAGISFDFNISAGIVWVVFHGPLKTFELDCWHELTKAIDKRIGKYSWQTDEGYALLGIAFPSKKRNS